MVGDTAFALVLMLSNIYLLLPTMRRVYVHVYALIQCSIIGCLMWFLWIYPGSGNANFFYFQSLAFVFTNSFLVIEAIGVTAAHHHHYTHARTHTYAHTQHTHARARTGGSTSPHYRAWHSGAKV